MVANEHSWYLTTAILKKFVPASWFFINEKMTQEQRQAIVAENLKNHTIWFPCSQNHNHVCHVEVIRKVEETFRNAWIVYAVVHVVPFLIFKRKQIKKCFAERDFKGLAKLFFGVFQGFLRSMSFIGLYTFFAMWTWCYGKNFFQGLTCKVHFANVS
jgi:hypothetical protein